MSCDSQKKSLFETQLLESQVKTLFLGKQIWTTSLLPSAHRYQRKSDKNYTWNLLILGSRNYSEHYFLCCWPYRSSCSHFKGKEKRWYQEGRSGWVSCRYIDFHHYPAHHLLDPGTFFVVFCDKVPLQLYFIRVVYRARHYMINVLQQGSVPHFTQTPVSAAVHNILWIGAFGDKKSLWKAQIKVIYRIGLQQLKHFICWI
jgi:hypothetical protein